MVAVTVLYPKTESSHFDFEYYLTRHIPMVQARWGAMGLTGAELLRGSAAMDGSAPAYELVGKLLFTSVEAMQAALEVHGAEILGDIPNFTNVQPLIQVNDPIPL